MYTAHARLRLLLLVLTPLEAAATLEFSAGWGLNVGTGANATWVNLQFGVGSQVAVQGRQGGLPSLFSLAWTARSPRADPVTGYCPSTIPRFGNTTRCISIRMDFQEYWRQTFASLQPFIANGTYIGIFLGDEHMWNGVSLADLKTACDAIKQLWPDAIIYINESQDVANCNFNRLGETVFKEGECFPETLDWFGYDYYDYDHTYGPEAGWQVQRDGMTNMIYPRLTRAEQRVVPTTLGFFPHVDPKNATQMAEVDAYCVHNAEAFSDWAAVDERIVGLFTFYWVTQPGSFVGMWDMPRCSAKWVELGRHVVARGSATGVLSRGGGRPGRTRTSCPTPTEKVKHHWCNKHV